MLHNNLQTTALEKVNNFDAEKSPLARTKPPTVLVKKPDSYVT